jgi:hypothetical protein
MKRIILYISVFAAFLPPVCAQETFGPEGGLNIANYKFNQSGNPIHTNSKNGIKVGLIFDNNLVSNLHLQYGVFYVMNGYQYSQGGDNISENVNTTLTPHFITPSKAKMIKKRSKHLFAAFFCYTFKQPN